MTDKPTVLIIGGLGYIGRFLAKYILDNSFASEIRLVDKAIPQMTNLAPEFTECLERCTFVHAEASRESAMSKVFDRVDGKAFDYVFNCGGETRYGQSDEMYRLRTLGLSSMCGREAAKRGVGVFIELSTGMVYKDSNKACVENDTKAPWNRVIHFKLEAEKELFKIEGLPHVYGPYMSQWMGLAISMARVYQKLDDDMKWPFSKDLRTNTVHIDDTVRAVWTTAKWYSSKKNTWDAASMGTPVPVFNVVDQGDTTQDDLAQLLSSIFSITCTFLSTDANTFAKLNLGSVVDEVNEEMLETWGELLAAKGITNAGPIFPYIKEEVINDSNLWLDGKRFQEVIGFTFTHPTITRELVEEIIASYQRMNWWP